MTPAVRRWLLGNAREELAHAEEEERYSREHAEGMRRRATENPELWGDESARASHGLTDAYVHRKLLEAAIGELSAGEPRVHILIEGRPLCGFSDKIPSQWPEGHTWVRLGEADADCSECVKRGKAAL